MKNKIILLNLYLLFSAVSFSLFAQQSVKVLAIGNSFSADAVEEFLDGLSTEGGTEITVANAFIGGCSLEKHWENIEKDLPMYSYRKIAGSKKTISKRTLLQCIQDEKWDYITFQQVSTLSGVLSSYFPYLTLNNMLLIRRSDLPCIKPGHILKVRQNRLLILIIENR